MSKKSYNSEEFKQIVSYIDVESYKALKKQSEDLGLPISRLIGIAVDNELDQGKPFNYPCDIPETYIEYNQNKECNLIRSFLSNKMKGLELRQLITSRRTVGVESRGMMLTCIRELLDRGDLLLEPPRTSYFSRWNADTVWVRYKDATGDVGYLDKPPPNQFKTLEINNHTLFEDRGRLRIKFEWRPDAATCEIIKKKYDFRWASKTKTWVRDKTEFTDGETFRKIMATILEKARSR